MADTPPPGSGSSGATDAAEWDAVLRVADVFVPGARFPRDPYCLDGGGCCFDALPVVSGSGGGSGYNPYGSGPGTGTGGGGFPPPFAECAGECTHFFYAMPSGGGDGGTGSGTGSGPDPCADPLNQPPTAAFLEAVCATYRPPWFTPAYAAAACWFLDHPIGPGVYGPNPDAPSFHDSEWPYLLQLWHLWRGQNAVAVIAACLGMPPPPEGPPAAYAKFETARLPPGSRLVGYRCVVVPASELCQLCAGSDSGSAT